MWSWQPQSEAAHLSVRADGVVMSFHVLLKPIKLVKGVNELCVVVFPGDMPRVLELDKRCLWKARLNADLAFPVNILLAVCDHDGEAVIDCIYEQRICHKMGTSLVNGFGPDIFDHRIRCAK